MNYWLITGIKDKRFKNNLEKNINRIKLSGLNVNTVIVETGEGVGLFSNALRQDKNGVVPFLETAFNYIRKKCGPDDWFVRIDCDDYYGPDYLKEIDKVRESGAVATGAPSIYVKTEKNTLYYCESKNKFNGACGGTLAGNILESVPFRDTKSPWGEDSQWVQDMILYGKNIVPRNSKDYAIVRWNNHKHTYPVAGDILPHFWNCNSYFLNEWSPNKLKEKPDKSLFIEMDKNKAIQGFKALNSIIF